jgi:XTP/dITP diphosphohydrolase
MGLDVSVYKDVRIAETEEEVAKNWEKLKLKEGRTSVLSGVPKSLPALVKASRISDKAASAGFDWDKREQVFEKVQEEFNELHVEVEQNSQRIEAEFGDVLFSLVNYARFINIDPESALERTNKKFIKRFQFLENEAAKEGKQLTEMTLEDMSVHWEKSKTFFK